MALPLTVDTLDSIPEAVRTEYVQKDGKYHLNVDGLDGLKTTLAKERTERERLEKELKDAGFKLSQIEGIDIEEAKRLLAEQRKTADQKAIDEGKAQELWAQKEAKLREDHTKQLTEAAQRAQAAETELQSYVLTNETTKAALAAGIVETALEDVTTRARNAGWTVQDRKPVCMTESGAVLVGETGAPLTLAEWLGKLKVAAPHLFKGNTGGGTEPAKGNGAPAGNLKRSTMSSSEKSAFIAKHGAEAFNRLPR